MSNSPTRYNSIFPSFIADNGIARSNRFVVNIALPPSFSQGSWANIPIEGAEFPSLGISTTDFKYDQAPSFSVPYERNPVGQVIITFLLDEAHLARKTIENWMEYIVNVPTTRGSAFGYSKSYYDEILGSIQIFQLSYLDGSVKSGVQLFNAYPTMIDTIKLDWSEENNYERMSVTFAFFDQKTII